MCCDAIDAIDVMIYIPDCILLIFITMIYIVDYIIMIKVYIAFYIKMIYIIDYIIMI